ncbi:acyltransferase domain-containing protein [Nocardia sp. NPDC050406]|uniref:acyltransferase domain-containing protein n=1 Tax=Nocardia sp. NPDC050406 TaxID=3364318 RepID=UPI0037B5387C
MNPLPGGGLLPEVAIVGLGRRWPVEGLAAEWNRLDAFDHDWFGVPEREAAELDSWQRMSLEVAVEALDDSGLGHLARGSNAAVVFGAWRAVGNIAQRLSRALGTHGPSLVLDSGDSSSVVAVDMAVRLLADGSVPFVIAGGVDLRLLPGISDERRELIADRSTAGSCTVVVLQRTADAERTGARIIAEIAATTAHSAIPLRGDRADAHNHEVARLDRGDEPPVLIPITGRDTTEVHDTARYWATTLHTFRSLREFAAATARLRPDPTRAAILAHSLADATTQLHALAARITAANQPVSAAHRSSPPALPSPDRTVVTEVFGPTTPRMATATTSPVRDTANQDRVTGQPGGLLFVFAGASEPYAGMARGLAARYPIFARALMEATDAIVAAGGPRVWTPRHGFGGGHKTDTGSGQGGSPEIGSGHEDHGSPMHGNGRGSTDWVSVDRRAEPGPTSSIGREGGGRGSAEGGSATGRTAADDSSSVGHVRAGDGASTSRVTGNGQVAASCMTGNGRPGVDQVGGEGHVGAAPGRAHSSRRVFAEAATFVYQVAMGELLAWWGIQPDAVVGYGVGEIAAAAASGALSLADAARVLVVRSGILSQMDGESATAVLEATAAEAMRLVEPMRAFVAVTAIDGARSITVSGEPRYIDALVRRAHRRTIFAQRLPDAPGSWQSPVSGLRAHELASTILEQLHGMTPKVPTAKVYSTARSGAVIEHAELDAAYWGENASSPVDLATALQVAASEGISTVLEIAPHPRLVATVREHVAFRDSTHPVAARGDEPATFLRALAHLHLEGRRLDWTVLGPFTAPPPRRRWRRPDHAANHFGNHTAASAPTSNGVARERDKPVDSPGIAPPEALEWGIRQYASSNGAAPHRTSRGAALVPADVSRSGVVGTGPDTCPTPQSPPTAVHEVFPAVEVRPENTYLVTGGLGSAGVAAVRWLLGAGAHDVVLLTREPRALPPPLSGMEDRIVLVRCDIGDRSDLAHVLHDLRECGPPICGVVHTVAESAEAAATVLELTAADTTDFTVLVSVDLESGAISEKLAVAHGYRRIVRVVWEAEFSVSDEAAAVARE